MKGDSMKRFICVLLILCLVPLWAFCVSDSDAMIETHNIYCGFCGASKIDSSAKVRTTDEATEYAYYITDKVVVEYHVKNGEVFRMACVCLDESEIGEFLAQCVTICYVLGGVSSGTVCYDGVLYRYLLARAGNEPEIDPSIPGLLIDLSKQTFGYLFIADVVE